MVRTAAKLHIKLRRPDDTGDSREPGRLHPVLAGERPAQVCMEDCRTLGANSLPEPEQPREPLPANHARDGVRSDAELCGPASQACDSSSAVVEQHRFISSPVEGAE
jgi:hypothetical protein